MPESPPVTGAHSLTPQQEHAAVQVASGRSDRQVAAAVDCARETVCRWRNEHAAFGARVAELVADQVRQVERAAVAGRSEAIAYLRGVVADPSAARAARIRAAIALLRSGIQPDQDHPTGEPVRVLVKYERRRRPGEQT